MSLFFLGVSAPLRESQAAVVKQPNIIFILVDDQGFDDYFGLLHNLDPVETVFSKTREACR